MTWWGKVAIGYFVLFVVVLVVALATLAVGLVGLSRIYLGVHYLSDVLAALTAAHATFEASPEGEHLEPLRDMNAARGALLSAALDIT